jgi:hypothetical protein
MGHIIAGQAPITKAGETVCKTAGSDARFVGYSLPGHVRRYIELFEYAIDLNEPWPLSPGPQDHSGGHFGGRMPLAAARGGRFPLAAAGEAPAQVA